MQIPHCTYSTYFTASGARTSIRASLPRATIAGRCLHASSCPSLTHYYGPGNDSTIVIDYWHSCPNFCTIAWLSRLSDFHLYLGTLIHSFWPFRSTVSGFSICICICFLFDPLPLSLCLNCSRCVCLFNTVRPAIIASKGPLWKLPRSSLIPYPSCLR